VREDPAVRRAAAAIGAAVLVAGCGGGSGKTHTATTSTEAVKPPARQTAPQYVPSAHHAHRPPGFVYNDEIGETVLTAPYDRIIQLFGPPHSRRGKCIVYRVVRQPNSKWTFCFKGQKMVSASG
jgi:hypothetical protein